MAPHIDAYVPKWGQLSDGRIYIRGWLLAGLYAIGNNAVEIEEERLATPCELPFFDEYVYLTAVHEDHLCNDHRPGIAQALGCSIMGGG